MNRQIVLTAFLLLMANALHAQVTITLSVKRPTPLRLSDWQRDRSIVRLIVNNPTQTMYRDAVVSFTLRNIKTNKIVIRTNDGSPALPTVQIPAMQTTILAGADIVHPDAIQFDGDEYKRLAGMVDAIPEGDYEICIRLLAGDRRTDIATNAPACTNLSIILPDAVRLIYPVSIMNLRPTSGPRFSWTPVAPVPPGSQIRYRMVVVPVFEGQNGRQAMDMNPVLFDKVLPTTSYLYMPADKPFSTVTGAVSFAWQIQALDVSSDPRGVPATRSDGFSEIGIFGFQGSNVQQSLALTLEIPGSDDVVQSTNPQFTISVNRTINRSAITGGYMKIWARSENEGDFMAFKRPPVFEMTFTGNIDKYLPLAPGGNAVPGKTILEIGDVNRVGASKSFAVTNGKVYFWEVGISFTGSLCAGAVSPGSTALGQLKSEQGKFKSGGGGGQNVVNGQCDSPCTPPVATTNTRLEQINVNEIIKIGLFDMKVTVVNNASPSSFSGEGIVTVPFFQSGIAATFANLKVNQLNQVYAGIAYAKFDPSPSLPQLNNLAPYVGLTPATVQTIQTWVAQTGRIIGALSGFSDGVALPVGIANTIPGTGETIIISIVSGQFSSQGAEVTTGMSIPIPFAGNDHLAVAADHVCLKPGGVGTGQNNTQMYLMEDLGYNPNATGTFSFAFAKGQPNTGTGTIVEFNCDGFQSLNLDAKVKFPTDWIVTVPGQGQVVMDLKNKIIKDKIKNWFFELDVNSPFAPASMPDFVIDAQKMFVDMSDLENAPNMVFPANYVGPKKNDILWHGFYMPELQMTLPNSIKTANNPVTIDIDNLLIDATGFTVDVRAENVVSYPKANFANGWGASLDSIGFSFVNSSFVNGGMSGQIGIPISDSMLVYTALLSKANSQLGFSFCIEPRSDINIPLWVATAVLDSTSQFTLSKNPGQSFLGSMVLNGHIDIKGKVGPFPLANLIGITFQGMTLQTQQPVFIPGNWSLSSPQKSLAGFDLNLNKITPKMDLNQSNEILLGLQFDMGLVLQKGNNGIAGQTVFTVFGNYNKKKFEKAQLDAIALDVDAGPAAHVKGVVNFYHDDPTWGNGFLGSLEATILKTIYGSANVQFGSLPVADSTYDYWYVDATVFLSAGMPIATGVSLYGAGMGVWHHMTAQVPQGIKPPKQAIPANAMQPGANNSGLLYVPDPNGDFGLKAKAVIGSSGNPTAFNADVELGMDMVNGGLNTMFLNGKAYMMTGLFERDNPKIFGGINVSYNVPAKTFHSTMALQINYSPLIKTIMPPDQPTVEIHADPNDFYLWFGRPASRVGVEMMSLLTANSYFQIGTVIDPPAPLPSQILNNLGSLASKFSDRGTAMENAVIQGGVSFGTETGFHTGRLSYGPFYGQFDAALGWDASLMDYGGAKCNGSNEPLGIDGWYLQAQAYAYLQAVVGIHLDILIASGDFDIFKLNAGAALKAQLPNPTWVAGVVYGEYAILDGLISGHAEFEFEVGEKCKLPQSNPLDNVKLISDFRPEGDKADVFSMPQASFSFPVNKPFELASTDPDGNTIVRKFRVVIDNYKLENTSSNKLVSGQWGVNVSGLSSAFVPDQMLEGNKTHKASITARAEEFKGSWKTAKNSKTNADMVETESRSFSTGPRPNSIPEDQVMFVYPMRNQRFFLQNEIKTGMIKTKIGVADMFSSPRPGYISKYIARYTPVGAGGQVPSVEVPVAPPVGKLVTFPIPGLANATVYKLVILRRDSLVSSGNASNLVAGSDLNSLKNLANTSKVAKTVYSASDSVIGGSGLNVNQNTKEFQQGSKLTASTVTISTSKLQTNLISSGETKLYETYFRTSLHNTLQQKLASGQFVSVGTLKNGKSVIIKPSFTLDEGVDKYDVTGYAYNDGNNDILGRSLITGLSNEQTRPWHTQYAKPEIYNPIATINNTPKKSSIFKLAFGNFFTTMYAKMLDSGQLVRFDLAKTSDYGLLKEYETHPAVGLNSGGKQLRPTRVDQGPYQFLGGFNTPATCSLTLDYRHGEAGAMDYDMLQSKTTKYLSTMVSDPTSMEGGYKPVKKPIRLIGDKGTTESTVEMLKEIEGKPYKKIFGGSYPLKLQYRFENQLKSQYNTTFTYQP